MYAPDLDLEISTFELLKQYFPTHCAFPSSVSAEKQLLTTCIESTSSVGSTVGAAKVIRHLITLGLLWMEHKALFSHVKLGYLSLSSPPSLSCLLSNVQNFQTKSSSSFSYIYVYIYVYWCSLKFFTSFPATVWAVMLSKTNQEPPPLHRKTNNRVSWMMQWEGGVWSQGRHGNARMGNCSQLF